MDANASGPKKLHRNRQTNRDAVNRAIEEAVHQAERHTEDDDGMPLLLRPRQRTRRHFAAAAGMPTRRQPHGATHHNGSNRQAADTNSQSAKQRERVIANAAPNCSDEQDISTNIMPSAVVEMKYAA